MNFRTPPESLNLAALPALFLGLFKKKSIFSIVILRAEFVCECICVLAM